VVTNNVNSKFSENYNNYKTLLKYLENTLFILIANIIVFLKLNQFRTNF
jgi:hypothetical protein